MVFTILGFRLLLCLLTVIPAFEKILSDGVDVARIHKSSLAACAKIGKRCLFKFHQTSGFVSLLTGGTSVLQLCSITSGPNSLSKAVFFVGGGDRLWFMSSESESLMIDSTLFKVLCYTSFQLCRKEFQRESRQVARI